MNNWWIWNKVQSDLGIIKMYVCNWKIKEMIFGIDRKNNKLVFISV